MSTRSRIAIKRQDNKIDSIYCHSDGYLEYNGVILFDFYKDINKLNKLIELGDISLLARNVNPDPEVKHGFDYDDRQEDVVVAYSRDRGEKNTHFITHKNIEEFKKYCITSDQEFAYLYDENESTWSYAIIPYELNKEMSFELLEIRLEELGLVEQVNSKLDDLIYAMMDYEKSLDLYEFNDVFDSEEDAYYNYKRVFSNMKGIDSNIDVVMNDLVVQLKEGTLDNEIVKENFENGINLVKMMNLYKNELNKDLIDDII